MKKMVAWKAESFHDRLERCRAMLAIHGYLPDSQSNRIRERIQRDRLKVKEGGRRGVSKVR